VATRDVFSEEELAQFRGFPEVSRVDLVRYFTLSSADKLFVRTFRGPANVLGVAVQLCTLPWLGFVPDEVGSVPGAAAARLAEVLEMDPIWNKVTGSTATGLSTLVTPDVRLCLRGPWRR
jgi:hypothetical protein